jgi:hypothetical protein
VWITPLLVLAVRVLQGKEPLAVTETLAQTAVVVAVQALWGITLRLEPQATAAQELHPQLAARL